MEVEGLIQRFFSFYDLGDIPEIKVRDSVEDYVSWNGDELFIDHNFLCSSSEGINVPIFVEITIIQRCVSIFIQKAGSSAATQNILPGVWFMIEVQADLLAFQFFNKTESCHIKDYILAVLMSQYLPFSRMVSSSGTWHKGKWMSSLISMYYLDVLGQEDVLCLLSDKFDWEFAPTMVLKRGDGSFQKSHIEVPENLSEALPCGGTGNYIQRTEMIMSFLRTLIQKD